MQSKETETRENGIRGHAKADRFLSSVTRAAGFLRMAIKEPDAFRCGLVRRFGRDIIAVTADKALKLARVRDQTCVKKIYFKKGSPASPGMGRELLADRIFRGRPWKVPIVKKGRRWLATPYLPFEKRLDQIALRMAEAARKELARQAVWILFDIFLAGYAHRDFHSENLFLIDGQLRMIDFEYLEPLQDGRRPPFPESYDITGEGLESPVFTNGMCFADCRPMSVRHVLGVTPSVALDLLRRDLREALIKAWGGRVSYSFELPYFRMEQERVRRDPAAALCEMSIGEEEIRGKTVLEIGTDAGGMLFSILEYGPGKCTGVSADDGKILLARQVAAFSGLNNYEFMRADPDAEGFKGIKGPFDVVLLRTEEGHSGMTGEILETALQFTGDILYPEGNISVHPERLRNILARAGFIHVPAGPQAGCHVPGHGRHGFFRRIRTA